MTVSKDHMREAFANARENGCTFEGWTDEEIALDVVTYDADLEIFAVVEIVAAIQEIRKESI